VIAPAVQVQARDDADRPITSFSGTITISIGSNPAGGTLLGTTSAVAQGGIATFGDLKIDTPGDGYTLAAGASGLAGALSQQFVVTSPPEPPPPPPPPPPPAVRLVFTVPPSTVAANTPIVPAVQVEAVDAQGNRATDFNGPVTLSFEGGAGGAQLSGNTVNAVGGVATFTDVRIDQPGTYALRAETGGGIERATSGPFTVTP
jgi:hypothetical protein